MESLLTIVAGAPKKLRRDDDAIDRFHHRYTTILLVVFAVVSTTHQLVGTPITCWLPKELDQNSWVKYTNTYCWVRNTYWLSFEEEIPKEGEDKHEIVYYQWIPFIFLGMAVFFFMPSVVWTSFNSKAGVDSDNILETAETFRHTEKLESKEKHLRLITRQMDRFVGSTPKSVGGLAVKKGSSLSSMLCCLCGKKFGNYLVILYIFTKLLYIANVFAQLFILNSVLQTQFNIYGFDVIKGFWEDDVAFLNHTVFPKVTMCDFHIRGLGNVRRYTVQCLLPVNLYTEKMFIFLWFWMVIVLALTIFNFISWILKSALPKDRHGFIENTLIMMDRVRKLSDRERALCWTFVHDYLRLDGVFVLRLIASNTNKITVSEIIASLWDFWREKTEALERDANDDEPRPDFTDTMDTIPLKLRPPPPPKPPKPNNFRPNAAPPAPPNYGSASKYPVSPAPSAPPQHYS